MNSEEITIGDLYKIKLLIPISSTNVKSKRFLLPGEYIGIVYKINHDAMNKRYYCLIGIENYLIYSNEIKSKLK